MVTKVDIALAALKELLTYDPESGNFVWNIHRSGSTTAGTVAGCRDHEGYIKIGFGGRSYKAATLAWFFFHEEWPPHEVDHINRNPSDNRIINLRKATRQENARNRGLFKNNKTGYKGVHYESDRGLYRASISIVENGVRKNIKLGRYKTALDAHKAYKAASKKYFGEFANAAVHPNKIIPLFKEKVT